MADADEENFFVCVFVLVVQHDVGHPDELRGNSDGRHVVEIGGSPLQLIVCPFLSNIHIF